MTSDTPKSTDGDDEPLSPALKWAGGKRWLRPRLRELWQACGGSKRRLHEPCCGALGVALGLRPREAMLRDANPHLINFHCHVRSGLRIRIPMRNESELYYAHRAAFNALIESGRALSARGAAYFYYLNRTGYNGLCRFNSRGLFNVPFGQYTTIKYRREFDELGAAMQGWSLATGDFASVDAGSDDFVYADPPYDTDFNHYSAGGFDWDDQQRLAEWLAALPGPVAASNSATPRIIALYEHHGFALERHASRRNINRDVRGRGMASEILATRNIGPHNGAQGQRR